MVFYSLKERENGAITALFGGKVRQTLVAMADTERKRPIIGAMFRGPGPAAYYLPGSTGYIGHDCTKYRKAAYSFGARTWKNQQLTGPGPKYKIDDVTRFGMEGTPKYTLHSRTSSQGKFQTPAPCEYNLYS